MTRLCGIYAVLLPPILAVASPARASDEEAQLWATQSLSIAVDDDIHIQFEAVERVRSAAFGGNQTQLRGAVEQEVGNGFSVAGGVVYQRSGRQDEIRLQQQLTYTTGPLSLRTRLEQRFQEEIGPTVWRLRQRIQLTETLDAGARWTLLGNAEGIWSLNGSTPEARTGLVALRTQVGLRHKLSERLTMTIAYVRQHEFRDGTPDRVGHAPLVGLSLGL